MKILEEPLSPKVENHNQSEVVRGKRKRYWGEIVVFPPPFKKRCMILMLSTFTKKGERDLEEKEIERICHTHPKKQALPDALSFPPIFFTVIFVNKRMKIYSTTKGLGFSGACDTKLRVSG